MVRPVLVIDSSAPCMGGAVRDRQMRYINHCHPIRNAHCYASTSCILAPCTEARLGKPLSIGFDEKIVGATYPDLLSCSAQKVCFCNDTGQLGN